MTGYIGGEGFSIPIIETNFGDISYECKVTPFDRYSPRRFREMLTPQASAEFTFRLTEAGMAWARWMIEEADRRQWIEGVKRRLGLIGPEDDAAVRLRQWEHDHLTVDDLPVALCAGGRELDTALMLELYDQRAAEVRTHPHLTGNGIYLFRLALYECDCCERRNVPAKLKGIGYICDDCLASWCWTGYEKGPAPESHYPVCPFKVLS